MRHMIVLMSLCGITSFIYAQTPTVQPDLPSFGLVGMVPANQFLRLSVTNLRLTGYSFLTSPTGVVSVGPCEILLSFSDDQGNALKSSDVRIGLNQSTVLDLMASDLPASLRQATTSRLEILPVVQRIGGCTLVQSVEVIAASTRQTNAYVLRQGANGNGAIPVYGLVGMARGSQFLRLNVSNLPIPGTTIVGTCEVALTFSDSNVNPLKNTELSLALGMSTHLDLTTADLPPATTEARVEVLPSVVQAGRCALNSSVEVISTATGQTNAYAAYAVLSVNR